MKKYYALIFLCGITSISCYGMFRGLRDRYMRSRHGELATTLNKPQDIEWSIKEQAAINKRAEAMRLAGKSDDAILKATYADLKEQGENPVPGGTVYAGGWNEKEGFKEKGNPVIKTTKTGYSLYVPVDVAKTSPIVQPSMWQKFWSLFGSRQREAAVRPMSSEMRTTAPATTSSGWFARWWNAKK